LAAAPEPRFGAQNHVGQSSFDELRRIGAAPAARAFAAETAVGQETECGFDRFDPSRARGFIGK